MAKPDDVPGSQDVRSLIMALQGNFDHLQGTLRTIAAAHNILVDDIADIVAALEDQGLEVDGKWTEAEHTALGDGSPHHEAATVGTGLDVAGQLITLDLSEVASGGELGGFMDAPTVDSVHAGSAHHAAATEGTGIDIAGQVISVDLSEIAAGGELGGTMDAPTVDTVHSGSSHAAAGGDHIADPTDAHDASAISVDSTTLSGTGADVQASLEELDNLLDDHSARHESGGADAVKLDDLAAPDDNTDLNASTTKHGLLRKLDNDATHYLDGQGGWTVPAGSGGGGSKMYAHWLGG